MGSHNTSHTFDGALTPTQLREAFLELQEQLVIEYGTDPYNGTFSTCDGLLIDESKVFDSEREADEYALQHAEKWGPAVAVRARQVETTTTQFLFDGKPSYNFGGPVGSYFASAHGMATKFQAADQLTAAEKTTAVKLYEAHRATEQAYKAACHNLQAHVSPIMQDYATPVPSGWTTALKALRKQCVKAEKAKTAASDKWHDFSDRMKAKYITTTTKELGQVWWVAGWAAS